MYKHTQPIWALPKRTEGAEGEKRERKVLFAEELPGELLPDDDQGEEAQARIPVFGASACRCSA